MKELFKLLADCMKQEAEKHIITASKPHRVQHAPTTVLVKSHDLEITFRREQVSNDPNSLRWYRLSIRQLNKREDQEDFYDFVNELLKMFMGAPVDNVSYHEKSLTTSYYWYRGRNWASRSTFISHRDWEKAMFHSSGRKGPTAYPSRRHRNDAFTVCVLNGDEPIAFGDDKPT